jgi:hypothetical protein
MQNAIVGQFTAAIRRYQDRANRDVEAMVEIARRMQLADAAALASARDLCFNPCRVVPRMRISRTYLRRNGGVNAS